MDAPPNAVATGTVPAWYASDDAAFRHGSRARLFARFSVIDLPGTGGG
jgi:hypothetical protein